MANVKRYVENRACCLLTCLTLVSYFAYIFIFFIFQASGLWIFVENVILDFEALLPSPCRDVLQAWIWPYPILFSFSVHTNSFCKYCDCLWEVCVHSSVMGLETVLHEKVSWTVTYIPEHNRGSSLGILSWGNPGHKIRNSYSCSAYLFVGRGCPAVLYFEATELLTCVLASAFSSAVFSSTSPQMM